MKLASSRNDDPTLSLPPLLSDKEAARKSRQSSGSYLKVAVVAAAVLGSLLGSHEAGAALPGADPAPAGDSVVQTATPSDAAPQLPAKSTNLSETTPSGDGASQNILGSEWLARQPGQNFTLQLLASHSRYTLLRFARQEGLAAPLAQFALDRDGKELHVLTQGSYASRAEAEQAAHSLPAGIHPWIRTVASVQQVMKREAEPAAGVRSPPSGGGIKDIAWVWSQDPGRYTVQLATAKSEETIEAVIRQSALPGELAVVQVMHKEQPRYALIYGSFADSDAARGVIARLPESLRQADPWPRSFATLHDEISRSTP
jgi:septal ring-binding cell division protein DamX